MTRPKTILIAGGAGFLGSHLADWYVKDSYRVIVIDNLSTGRRKNIAHLEGNQLFTFLEHDICKPLPANYFDPSEVQYDVVANLASPASPPQYQRLALETLEVGSLGTFNLLSLARLHEARFFHASTSEVYGDPEVHPQPENYKGSVNSYGPRAMYDEAKRYAEALIYTYRHKYGINSCIARFFNTYGPRMDPQDGRVVSNFIVQALQNKPLTIYGDGTQTRSFCYVDDLVEGIVALIASNQEGPMNLGNPKEFTMLELAELVQKMTATQAPLIYKPLPGDDPTQRQPVIKLAAESLGWHPKISLKEGLKPTIEYFAKEVR